MGLGPAAVQLTLELHQRGFFDRIKSVAEIGSQEIHVQAQQFETLVRAAGISSYRPEDFPAVANYPGHPRASARPLYELLGARAYACVDINKDYGAIPHDLNKPFEDAAHIGQYDLVTDHGSCEHAFNVAEAYRTVHRLCRPGGIILSIQQVYGGNGYYNFDLSFFEGIAAANGYRILYAGYVVTPPNGDEQFLVPVAASVLDVLDWGKVAYLGVAYVFEKIKDVDFVMPYQGGYLADVQGHRGFSVQFSHVPPGRTFLPVFNLNGVSTSTLARTLALRLKRKLFRSE